VRFHPRYAIKATGRASIRGGLLRKIVCNALRYETEIPNAAGSKSIQRACSIPCQNNLGSKKYPANNSTRATAIAVVQIANTARGRTGVTQNMSGKITSASIASEN